MTAAKRWAALGAAAWAACGAAPRPPAISFPAAAAIVLPNGVLVASQPVENAALIGAQISFPAGLDRQRYTDAGVTVLAAAVVLHTPVDGGRSVTEAADSLGANVSYSLNAGQTRYYIECRPKDFPRLLHDLSAAINRPASENFERERSLALANQKTASKNPTAAAFDLIREARYQGSGYAYPEPGLSSNLERLQLRDAVEFASSYRHGIGTVVALEGAITPAEVQAVKNEFSSWPRSAGAAVNKPAVVNRARRIIAQRDIATTWAAIGYQAPAQYSSDFAPMLVVQALLGGDGSSPGPLGGGPALNGYLGAYYQYEADPGVFVLFLNGAGGDIEKAMRETRAGVDRLRSRSLDRDLLERAKRLAIGNYYTSITTLADASWLLARAAASPQGPAFENDLPTRISRVSAADVRRVARTYLGVETTAIITPPAGG